MAKYDSWNFLEGIKNLIVGGGRMKDGTTPRDDAGFAHDVMLPLTAIDLSTTITANTTTGAITASGAFITSSETNLRVASFAASTTALGQFEFFVPRDYDEATDSF